MKPASAAPKVILNPLSPATPEPAAPTPPPAAVAPATPPAEAEPPKTFTPEERLEFAKQLGETMWGETAAPAAIAPAEPPAAPAAPPAVPPATPPATPAAEPEPEPPPQPDVTDIIRRTSAATAAEIVRQQAPPAPSAPTPPAFDMGPEDAEHYRVLQFLERTQPDKFTGKPAEFLEFVRKNYAYQDNWEADNRGEAFDPNSDSHAEFYAKNQPNIDPKDIEDGKIEMRVEEKFEKRFKPIEEREKAEEQRKKSEEAFQKAVPAIAATVSRHTANLLKLAVPDLAKTIEDANGNVVLTPENDAKLAEADPLAYEMADVATKHFLQPLLLELEKCAIPDMNYRIDTSAPGEVGILHRKIDAYRAKAEQDLMAAPTTARTKDGKEFRTVAQHHRAVTEIQNGRGTQAEKDERIAALDDTTWRLTIDNLQEIIVDDCAKNLKSLVEKTDGLARKKYVKAASNGGQPAPPPPPPTPAPAAGRGRPPSISSASDVVTSPAAGQPQTRKYEDEVRDVMFK